MECTIDAGEDVSRGVILAVAAYENKRPEDLPPLYDFIEPDALDELHSGRVNGQVFSGQTSFTFSSSQVQIYGGSPVTVEVLSN